LALASSQPSQEHAGATTLEATLSLWRLHRGVEEWMKPLSDSVPEEELPLFYFSPKYKYLLFQREKEGTWIQARVVQLGP